MTETKKTRKITWGSTFSSKTCKTSTRTSTQDNGKAKDTQGPAQTQEMKLRSEVKVVEKKVTVIKYNVLETILRDWLNNEFGEEATYVTAAESGADYWKVTAPRAITAEEQNTLKEKGMKKRRTLTLKH